MNMRYHSACTAVFTVLPNSYFTYFFVYGGDGYTMKRCLYAVLAVALCSAFLISIPIYVNKCVCAAVSVSGKGRKTVIIDAGHGGFDGGAVAADGTLEKDINLEVANALADICRVNGLSVITIRETDDALDDDHSASLRERKRSDINNRLSVINENADAIFVSIHMNKFSSGGVHGAQIFYGAVSEESKLLAECIRKELLNVDPDNKRVVKKCDSSVYLLKKAKCPAVIAECGFLSNVNDLNNLKNDEYRRKTAFSIYLGILEYLNGE